MANPNRDTQSTDFSKMESAIDKHFKADKPIVFAGNSLKPADLKKILKAQIDAAAATKAAEKAWHDAVAEERKVVAENATLVSSFRKYVMGLFGETSATLNDFGIEPKKVTKRSVEQKAAAVAKRRATLAAKGKSTPPPSTGANGSGKAA